MDPTEAQRRDERVEHGKRRANAAFPRYEVAVTLGHGARGCWHVAIHITKDMKLTDSGEDLDAVLARLASALAQLSREAAS